MWPNARILSIRIIGTKFSEILSEFMHVNSRKCIWRCRLENGDHFCLGLNVLGASCFKRCQVSPHWYAKRTQQFNSIILNMYCPLQCAKLRVSWVYHIFGLIWGRAFCIKTCLITAPVCWKSIIEKVDCTFSFVYEINNLSSKLNSMW